MTKNLKFLSVCSGIEAASVAWNPLGWEAVAFSEIEKFPSAVLEYRYPDIPNLGDMTKIDTASLGHVDIFSGGTPCQAFSIAGLRNSLDDARGNLSLEFVRIAHELAAGNGLRNVVWENVPGVLSTKDNAFGCFLGGLVGADDAIPPPRGAKWPNAGMVSGPKGRAAWRILDAQFFGLAQRRKRVIVVADFGNGADPAAVLFERASVHGNTPPRREKGEGVAPTTAECFSASSIGTYKGADVSGAVRAAGGDNGGGSENLVSYAPAIARCVATREGSSQDYETTTMVAQTYAIQERAVSDNLENGPQGKRYQPDVAYTLEARNKVQAVCATGEIAHTLKAEGFDASEDGTGRGTPIVAFDARQADVLVYGDHTGPLDTGFPGPAICFTAKDYGADAALDIAPTLRSGTHDKSHANGGVVPAVTVALRSRDGGGTAELGGSVATALRASSGGGDKPHVLVGVNSIGELYGKKSEADSSSVLSTLRKAVGEKAYAEWGTRILAAVQSEEILRSWLHGQSIRKQAEDFKSFVDDCPLPCEESEAGGMLREVWINGPNGCSSQGRGLAKQLAGKSGEALSVLSYEGTQDQNDMQHLRKASEGAWLLREALSKIQEVRGSNDGEGKPEYTRSAVRRLTAVECERLMGFKDGYTDIPWRGKDHSPDGPRYKALGNSWAVPLFVWLGERITRLMPAAQPPANDNAKTSEAA